MDFTDILWIVIKVIVAIPVALIILSLIWQLIKGVFIAFQRYTFLAVFGALIIGRVCYYFVEGK